MGIICDNCCEGRRRPRQGKYNHPLLKYTDAAEAEIITALTINFYQTPFKVTAVLCGNEPHGGILPLLTRSSARPLHITNDIDAGLGATV